MQIRHTAPGLPSGGPRLSTLHGAPQRAGWLLLGRAHQRVAATAALGDVELVSPIKNGERYGYGSIPIDTFLVG